MELSKRGKVRIISYAAGLMLALVGIILAGRQVAFENRRFTHTSYLRQTQELASGIDQIGEKLEISLLSQSSKVRLDAAFDIWQLSSRCLENLTDLPLSEYNTEQLLRFLNESGEYARALASKESLTETERKNLISLHEYSAHLAEKLYALSDDILAKKSGFDDAKVPQLEKTGYLCFSCDGEDAAKALSGITDDAPDYPDLTLSEEADAPAADIPLEIEEILKKLSPDAHILDWRVNGEVVEIDIAAPSQNLYTVIFDLAGNELSIKRAK